MSKKKIKDQTKVEQSKRFAKFCVKMFHHFIELIKLLKQCITYKIILLIIAVFIVVSTFSTFKKDVQKQININTKGYLSSMVTESLEKVKLKINEEFNVLRTMSLLYDQDNDIDFKVTKKILKEEAENHSFIGIELLNKNKKELFSYGSLPEIESSDYIDNALKGNNGISPIVVDNDNNSEYIALAVPVTNKEKGIIGALVCYYDINEFTQIVDNSSFEKVGTTIISQEDGTLVSRPESIGNNTNLFNLLDSININNGKSIAKLKKYIKNGQSGLITCGSGKYKRYICYNIIPDTEWYSISIVSANSMEPVAKKVSTLAVALAGRISTIFAIYIIITLIIDMKLLKNKNAANNLTNNAMNIEEVEKSKLIEKTESVKETVNETEEEIKEKLEDEIKEKTAEETTEETTEE